MSRRVLELALLAYPRPVRQRDGEHLLDLAADLAETHGSAREVLGLLRGGLAERRRRRSPRQRVAIAVSVVVGSVLVALTWTATAAPLRVEEDRFSCSGECAETRSAVDDRVRDGWTCSETRTPSAVSWRCVRD